MRCACPTGIDQGGGGHKKSTKEKKNSVLFFGFGVVVLVLAVANMRRRRMRGRKIEGRRAPGGGSERAASTKPDDACISLFIYRYIKIGRERESNRENDREGLRRIMQVEQETYNRIMHKTTTKYTTVLHPLIPWNQTIPISTRMQQTEPLRAPLHSSHSLLLNSIKRKYSNEVPYPMMPSDDDDAHVDQVLDELFYSVAP